MVSDKTMDCGSIAVPFVHARRLLDWLRWSGTDEWDSSEPGPPEWRDAFRAFERVVGEAEKRLGPLAPYCGYTEGVQATEQESKDLEAFAERWEATAKNIEGDGEYCDGMAEGIRAVLRCMQIEGFRATEEKSMGQGEGEP